MELKMAKFLKFSKQCNRGLKSLGTASLCKWFLAFLRQVTFIFRGSQTKKTDAEPCWEPFTQYGSFTSSSIITKLINILQQLKLDDTHT
jgi:hypothetical protein